MFTNSDTCDLHTLYQIDLAPFNWGWHILWLMLWAMISTLFAAWLARSSPTNERTEKQKFRICLVHLSRLIKHFRGLYTYFCELFLSTEPLAICPGIRAFGGIVYCDDILFFYFLSVLLFPCCVLTQTKLLLFLFTETLLSVTLCAPYNSLRATLTKSPLTLFFIFLKLNQY